MSTIAVTGGTGHLGRQVVSLLKAEGHRVRVLARSPGQDPDVEWVQGNLATGRSPRSSHRGRGCCARRDALPSRQARLPTPRRFGQDAF